MWLRTFHRRGLLLTSWQPLRQARAALPAPLQQALVLLRGPVPHTLLLPRCGLVAHPGGSGTTAAGEGGKGACEHVRLSCEGSWHCSKDGQGGQQ